MKGKFIVLLVHDFYINLEHFRTSNYCNQRTQILITAQNEHRSNLDKFQEKTWNYLGKKNWQKEEKELICKWQINFKEVMLVFDIFICAVRLNLDGNDQSALFFTIISCHFF